MSKSSKTIKLFLLSLAIVSGCAVDNNINNMTGKKENIVYKDGDFTFSTKDLSSNYVESKLRKLNTANNGSALVRFLDFARDKGTTAGNIPVLMRNIFQADSVLKDSIRNNSVVIAKRNESPDFNTLAEFVFSEILSTPSATPTSTPQTGEFQVNTYTEGFQFNPDIAIDSNNNFVVTWSSTDQDATSWGIYGQRYNSDGTPQGSQFQMNTYTTGNQDNSSVAMDSNGNFVVTWTSQYQDNLTSGVYGQRYNSDGTPQGSEFQVNTYNTSAQRESSIAMDSSGNFVVTWTSNKYESGLGSRDLIYGQRYNSGGTPQGSEFQVNTYNTYVQRESSIAMDGSAGNFVITWTSYSPNSLYSQIYGQRYNSDGTPQGSEFQVTTYTTNFKFESSTAIDSNGNFVVAWTDYDRDSREREVNGQRYNSDGIPQGSEFQVSSTYSTEPSVAFNINGDFIITWGFNDLNSSVVNYGIRSQRYNSNGIVQGSEFRTGVLGSQPSTVIDSNSNLVATFTQNSDIYIERHDSNGNPI